MANHELGTRPNDGGLRVLPQTAHVGVGPAKRAAICLAVNRGGRAWAISAWTRGTQRPTRWVMARTGRP